MKKHPPTLPRWIQSFIERWLADRFQEEFMGDLTEYYHELVEDLGRKRANARISLALLSYLRPYFFKGSAFSLLPTNILPMIRLTSKIFLRQMRRKPLFSALNILGLSLGIAASFLISLFVWDELGYDSFHREKVDIHRVLTSNKLPGSDWINSARSSRMIGPALLEAYPEVESQVRLFNRWEPKVLHKNQYIDQRSFFAESSFFSIFSFELLQGDPSTCLSDPNSVVLTESLARKYFNSLNVLGETLEAEDSLFFQITGIVKDPPKQSHLQFDLLFSFPTWEKLRPPNQFDWVNYWLYTYIKLKPTANSVDLGSRISGLVHDNFGKQMEQFGLEVKLGLEALPDIYLHSQIEDQPGSTGNITTVKIFMGIGILMLLLAAFNFINLATARSMDRAIEVGMKKVVGSSKSNLTKQFLIESIFVCLIALVFGLALAGILLPVFNGIAGKELELQEVFQPQILAWALVFALCLGMLSGAYPAWVLSSFRPIQTLVKRYSATPKGLLLRKSLMVSQFCISLVLIVATLVIFRQLNYLQQKELGFDQDQVLVIDADGLAGSTLAEKYPYFKKALRENPAIQQIAASSRVPGEGRGGGVMFPEGIPEEESREFSYFSASPDFIPTMGIELLVGREFLPNAAEEEPSEMLVNEALLSNLGWELSDQVLGKHITAGWNGEEFTIVGVYKDYHQLSPREEIKPELIVQIPTWYHFISMKINSDELHRTIRFLEGKWQEWFPQNPFKYFFLDEYYNRQYQKDLRLSRLIGIFSILAIFIACIGLFGLTLFAFQQRKKEIGIRKVLGASEKSLLSLLLKDFLMLILLAFLLGIPISYLAMSRWLENFAYSIELSPGIFLLAGLGLFLFALLAMIFQTLSATKSQPALSLRDE